MKKSIIQQHVLLPMLILVSLMAASLCAQSQNRIQDTPIFPDNNSIIRIWQHGGIEYWVTCSYKTNTIFSFRDSPCTSCT